MLTDCIAFSRKERFMTGYLRIIGIVLALLSLVSLPVWATDGHQLAGLGALQTGTGGAGVASAKDSTWMLLNPASIVSLERRFDFSLEVFAPYRYLKPDGPLLIPMANRGAGKMSDDSIFYIPAMGIIIPKGRHYFGAGAFAVNGMGVNYSHSRTLIPRLFGQNFDRQTKYGVMKTGLSYAYEFENGIALGATLTLDYARFRTDMLTLNFWETHGNNRTDDNLGAGLTLGVYKRWERLSLGAAYTTPQWMQDFDKYPDLLPLPMDIPQTVQTGLAYKILPNLEWALDYKYINWAGVEQIGKAPIKGGFGWHDQHVVKSGVTWQVNPKWALRTGVSYGKSPIRRDVVFANGLFPAIVESHAMFGVSYALSKRSDIHFTYEHAFGKTLTDSGKGDIFSFVGKGTKIHLAENTFTAQYSYKF
jgi:long-chain fatty acid transport protein